MYDHIGPSLNGQETRITPYAVDLKSEKGSERSRDRAGVEAAEIGVCLASFNFYPIYAGPPLRFQMYAPGLAKRGVRVHVFTQAINEELVKRDGDISRKHFSPGGVPLYEVIDGLPVHRVRIPSGWRHEPAFFRRLARHCRGRKTDTSVVQFLNAGVWAIPWLLKIRRMGFGMVFTHTLLGELAAGRLKRLLQRFRWRTPLNLFDFVVVSSKAMRRQLEEIGVSAPIVIIPNGVNLARFSPPDLAARTNLREKLGLPCDKRLILSVGPIIPRKGTDVLVTAFASVASRYPDTQLALVGPRHDLVRPELCEFSERIQAVLRDNQIQNRVTFTGAVSNVEDYLRCADIMVFASRREGMPNVVPEAMACALPVIMTPFVGLPSEFGRAGKEYVLTGWHPEQMAADLSGLLSDQRRSKKIGTWGRNWVEQHLDVEDSLDSYAELYSRASARRA